MVVSSDASDVSYNQLGFYEMGVKQANSYFISLAPENFPKPGHKCPAERARPTGRWRYG